MRKIYFLVLFFLLTACNESARTEAPVYPTELPVPIPALSDTATQPQYGATVTQVDEMPGMTPIPQASATQAETNLVVIDVHAFPDPADYIWQPVVDGLSKPLGLAHARDGSGRLFVVEQAGRIWIIQDGQLNPRPFLDIRWQVGSSGFEQGLLGLAFHPLYAENGYFYVNYTKRNDDSVVARFQVSQKDAFQADAKSETQLLVLKQPFQNHNGGEVAFGPDGYLYLGFGDGGSGGDPRNFAQSLDTFLGKILRLDVDSAQPYAIPTDNPFATGGGLPEIWAYGLRNPWRFTFDRVTGDLYIADVGQNQWEEVDFIPAGAPGGLNFGWKFYEGSYPFESVAPLETSFVFPVVEYSHAEGCSVTGGVVYRGHRLPAWQGIYLYGDYCSGRVWGLLRDTQNNWMSQVLFEGMGRITAFGEDEAGEVYLIDQAGIVYVLGKR